MCVGKASGKGKENKIKESKGKKEQRLNAVDIYLLSFLK